MPPNNKAWTIFEHEGKFWLVSPKGHLCGPACETREFAENIIERLNERTRAEEAFKVQKG